MIFINLDIFIDKVEFCVFKSENHKKDYILNNKIIIPKSFNIGDKLNYIRKYIKTIINFHSIEFAYINIDDNAGINFTDIVKIEGVMEELFSNCGVIICK